jgi:hypothetical protein
MQKENRIVVKTRKATTGRVVQMENHSRLANDSKSSRTNTQTCNGYPFTIEPREHDQFYTRIRQKPSPSIVKPIQKEIYDSFGMAVVLQISSRVFLSTQVPRVQLSRD